MTSAHASVWLLSIQMTKSAIFLWHSSFKYTASFSSVWLFQILGSSFEEDETQLKTDAFKKYSDGKADLSSPDLSDVKFPKEGKSLLYYVKSRFAEEWYTVYPVSNCLIHNNLTIHQEP